MIGGREEERDGKRGGRRYGGWNQRRGRVLQREGGCGRREWEKEVRERGTEGGMEGETKGGSEGGYCKGREGGMG